MEIAYKTIYDKIMKHIKKFNESVEEKVNMYGYPTLTDVETANYHQILSWWRHLPSPGKNIPNSLSNEEFKIAIDRQAEVMNLIADRFKAGEGFTPSSSKSIGWKNESVNEDKPQKGICCPKCNYKNAEYLGPKGDKIHGYKCIKCNTEYSILHEVVWPKLPIDLVKAKEIKNVIDIINKYESWKENMNSTILDLNAKNIDYLKWSYVDIYKYYLENIANN